jgi:hypothetical protein
VIWVGWDTAASPIETSFAGSGDSSRYAAGDGLFAFDQDFGWGQQVELSDFAVYNHSRAIVQMLMWDGPLFFSLQLNTSDPSSFIGAALPTYLRSLGVRPAPLVLRRQQHRLRHRRHGHPGHRR